MKKSRGILSLGWVLLLGVSGCIYEERNAGIGLLPLAGAGGMSPWATGGSGGFAGVGGTGTSPWDPEQITPFFCQGNLNGNSMPLPSSRLKVNEYEAPPSPPGGPSITRASKVIQNGDVYYISSLQGIVIQRQLPSGELIEAGFHPLDLGEADLFLKGTTLLVISPGEGAVIRIDAFDVSDPVHLKTLQGATLEGDLGQSSFVGDILYIAHLQFKDCTDCTGNIQPMVTSFALEKGGIVQTDQAQGSPTWASSDRRAFLGENRAYWLTPSDVTHGFTRVESFLLNDSAGHLSLGDSLELEGSLLAGESAGVLHIASVSPTPRAFAFDAKKEGPLALLSELTLPGTSFHPILDNERAFFSSYDESLKKRVLQAVSFEDPSTVGFLGQLPFDADIWHVERWEGRWVVLESWMKEGQRFLAISLVQESPTPVILSRVELPINGFPLRLTGLSLGLQQVKPGGFWPLALSGIDPYKDPKVDGLDASLSTTQLVLLQMDLDKLSPRGQISFPDLAERFFLDKGKIEVFATEAARVLDVSDPDAPSIQSERPLIRNVSRIFPLGKQALRVTRGAWKLQQQIELVPLDGCERADPLAQQPLPDELHKSLEAISLDGERLRLLLGARDKSSIAIGKISASGGLDALLNAPLLVSFLGFPTQALFRGALAPTWQGDALFFFGRSSPSSTSPYVLDSSDITAPLLTEVHPEEYPVWDMLSGPIGRNQQVFISRLEANASACFHVLTRVDVSNPKQPIVHGSRPIPGSLLHVSVDGSLIISVNSQPRTQGCPLNEAEWSLCSGEDKTLFLSSFDGEKFFSHDQLSLDGQFQWLSDTRAEGDLLHGLLVRWDPSSKKVEQRLMKLANLQEPTFLHADGDQGTPLPGFFSFAAMTPTDIFLLERKNDGLSRRILLARELPAGGYTLHEIGKVPAHEDIYFSPLPDRLLVAQALDGLRSWPLPP